MCDKSVRGTAVAFSTTLTTQPSPKHSSPGNPSNESAVLGSSPHTGFKTNPARISRWPRTGVRASIEPKAQLYTPTKGLASAGRISPETAPTAAAKLGCFQPTPLWRRRDPRIPQAIGPMRRAKWRERARRPQDSAAPARDASRPLPGPGPTPRQGKALRPLRVCPMLSTRSVGGAPFRAAKENMKVHFIAIQVICVMSGFVGASYFFNARSGARSGLDGDQLGGVSCEPRAVSACVAAERFEGASFVPAAGRGFRHPQPCRSNAVRRCLVQTKP